MTPFGLFMRKLRLDKGLLLKDLADQLDVTSAYLSALEHGKKGVPSNSLVELIEERLSLSATEKVALRQAVKESPTSLQIPARVSPRAYQTAAAFARRLPSLSDQDLQAINRYLEDKDKP